MMDAFDTQTLPESIRQRILVQTAVRHDRGEIRPLPFQQHQIRQWIAVDDDKIRDRSGSDDAQPAALVQYLGTNDGDAAQDLDRRLRLGSEAELAGLVGMQFAEE